MRFIGLSIAALLLTFVLLRVFYCYRRSDEERIEHDARVAARNLVLLQSGRIWRSPSLLIDRALGRATHSRYTGMRHNSENDLISRGYFEKRTFHFEHGTRSWKEFIRAMDRRFTDGEYHTCAFQNSESSIVVITRPSRMASWEQLVREYDKLGPQ